MDRLKASAFVHEVFDAWAPSLARHARRLTGDSSLADDLVQEAFLALYRELRAGRRVDNPRAWTLTVVRHYAARMVRDKVRHRETLMPTESFDLMARPQRESLEESEQEVSRLLSVLTEREEEVVLLRMECLKYREIADQLGINGKTVATLLARALRKLHQAIGRRDGLPGLKRQDVDVPKALQ